MKTRHYYLPLLVALIGWSCATLTGPPPVPQEVIDAILERPCTEYAARDTVFIGAVHPDSIPPKPESTPTIRFIRYDIPPRPVGGYETVRQNVRSPEEARQAGIEGTVIVQAFVDEKGCVRGTIILVGSSDPGLDEAAIDAVRNTRFIPAFRETDPVGV
jgi:protein TonB